jgi:hypothetical protein
MPNSLSTSHRRGERWTKEGEVRGAALGGKKGGPLADGGGRGGGDLDVGSDGGRERGATPGER